MNDLEVTFKSQLIQQILLILILIMYILAGMQFGPGRTFNFWNLKTFKNTEKKTIDDSEKLHRYPKLMNVHHIFLKYKNIPEKLTSLLGSSAVTWVAF